MSSQLLCELILALHIGFLINGVLLDVSSSFIMLGPSFINDSVQEIPQREITEGDILETD